MAAAHAATALRGAGHWAVVLVMAAALLQHSTHGERGALSSFARLVVLHPCERVFVFVCVSPPPTRRPHTYLPLNKKL